MLWQLGLPLDDLDSVSNRPVAPADAEKIATLFVARISSRKPAAYLTQEAWLQGVPFYVDERAIVPRSLIAELTADGSIDPWLGEHTTRVLDLCTGNGSLAVLAAMAWPDIRVDASDLSADALAVARINVGRHGLQARITLHPGGGRQARGAALREGLAGNRIISVAGILNGTCNTASRMESHGLAGRVHVHESMYLALRGRHTFEHRGVIDVKGLGAMSTYFLLGRAPPEPHP